MPRCPPCLALLLLLVRDFENGCDVLQDSSYANSWSWFLKPRAQAKEKKLLENFHAAGFPLPKGFKGK